jgi:hypothetical protein
MKIFVPQQWFFKRGFNSRTKLNFTLPSNVKISLYPCSSWEKFLEYEIIVKSISFDKNGILNVHDEENNFRLLESNRHKLINENLTPKDIYEILKK